MKSWEELSRKEQLSSIHYDLYKDVHGIRPRWMDYDAMSEEELEKELDRLQEEFEESMVREKALQDQAIKAFEKRVLETIDMGAVDRNTAIRWIADAEEATGDLEYLCFKVGIPYGYFNEVTNVQYG